MDCAAMTPAASAAVEVAMDVGLDVREPPLLHETNNTVLSLQPEAVVAKVATRPDAGLRMFEDDGPSTLQAHLLAAVQHGCRVPRVCTRPNPPTGSYDEAKESLPQG
jgi:hypothetical protein